MLMFGYCINGESLCERSVTGADWAKKSQEWSGECESKNECSVEREVAEWISQKWALTRSGKTARSAPMLC